MRYPSVQELTRAELRMLLTYTQSLSRYFCLYNGVAISHQCPKTGLPSQGCEGFGGVKKYHTLTSTRPMELASHVYAIITCPRITYELTRVRQSQNHRISRKYCTTVNLSSFALLLPYGDASPIRPPGITFFLPLHLQNYSRRAGRRHLHLHPSIGLADQ